jgi:BT1 family.
MIGLGLLSCASASVSALKLTTGEMMTDHDDSLHRSHRQRLHEKLLSCFQSDAATFRNIGSFLSQLLSFALIMAYRLVDHGNKAQQQQQQQQQQQEKEENETEYAQHQLSDGLITVFFLLSSLFPFMAAFVVAKYGLFRTCCGDNEVLEDDNTCQRKDRDLQHFGIFRLIKYDLIGLVIFQLLLLLIGVRSIIVENTSSRTFVMLSFLLGTSMVISILLSRSKQVFPSNEYVVTHTSIDGSSERKRIESMVQQLIYLKKVGLYLVLRHAVPTLDVILSSFIYTIFRYKPLLLQSMSILGSGVAAISTWTYNKRFAEKFSSVDGIKHVIILATTACCVWGMLTIPFIRSFRNLIKDDKFTAGTMLLGTFTLFRLIGGFLNEISFMPSIILATTTVIHEDAVNQNNDVDHDDDHEDEDDVFEHELDPDINGLEPPEQSVNCSVTKTIDSGIQYGFLVACIDFGDQMSTFISMPLITFFGVTRENDWNNLEWFIFTCSILGMLSLIFLRLLPI